MKAEEKARELVEKYHFILTQLLESEDKAKQCALIAVDEIILHSEHWEIYYWEEVKNQIKSYDRSTM